MPYTETHNDHRINYYDTKDFEVDRGKGRLPIFMIHGLGSSQNYYMPVISKLPDYRCIAMDTYGAARSKSRGEHLSLGTLVEDVIGVMNNLSVSKAFIAGHSMGGPLACAVASTHPGRVAGVVCIGPVNPGSLKSEVFAKRIETVLKDGMEPLADSIPTAATNPKSTALQKAIIRELILNQEPKSYASHCTVIMNLKNEMPDWKAIKAPVLILAGEEDMSAPLEGCQAIHQNLAVQQKELKIMSSVGHWHCVEADDQVAMEIADFCTHAT